MLSDTIEEHIKATDARAQMRRGIRSAVRGFWSREFGRSDFEAFMESSIRRGITSAWAQGAERAGILENELTDEELRARESFIQNQYHFIFGFASDIEDNLKGVGYLQPLLDRVELWVSRFDEAVEQAFAMAAQNKKLKWVYHPEKRHCSDCKNYNGRVYRARVWDKYGIHPKMWHLACKGLHCGCEFEETDDPVTPGRPPGPTG